MARIERVRLGGVRENETCREVIFPCICCSRLLRYHNLRACFVHVRVRGLTNPAHLFILVSAPSVCSIHACTLA